MNNGFDRGVAELHKMIDDVSRRLAPIEAQIRANEVREAEAAPMRKYFVVDREYHIRRDHEALEAKLPPTRASVIRAALEDLGRDDAKEKKP